MRRVLFLASILIVSLAAHADTIDDFVLTGEGHIITFSAPDAATVMDHPHIVSLGENVSVTIDGVSGYTELATFFLPFLNPPSVTLTVPTSIDGGDLQLYGAYLLNFTIIPIANPTVFHPDDIATTFILGLHTLTDGTPGLAPAAYTLTITPEATTASTPEPSSLILLSTGTLGLLGLAGRRRNDDAQPTG